MRLACEALDLYDRERKERGKQAGPLGTLGPSVYRHLAYGQAAFEDLTQYRSAQLARDMVRSRGAVDRALSALAEHGFIVLAKRGYSFSDRLVVPEAALVSFVEWLSDPELNKESRELAAKLAAILEETRTAA